MNTIQNAKTPPRFLNRTAVSTSVQMRNLDNDLGMTSNLWTNDFMEVIGLAANNTYNSKRLNQCLEHSTKTVTAQQSIALLFEKHEMAETLTLNVRNTKQ